MFGAKLSFNLEAMRAFLENEMFMKICEIYNIVCFMSVLGFAVKLTFLT